MSLEIRNLDVSYGAVSAIRGVDLDVAPGVITTIIGANGAGKTTIMKAIVGLVRASTGQIRLAGQELGGRRPAEIVAAGVALVPEGRRLFSSMTVRENLNAGAYLRIDAAAVARDRSGILDRFPILREKLDHRAGSLSGGQQQMLALARALMSRPRLLLLDEPSIGLAPIVVQQIGDIVRAVSQEGVDVLLVEQNAVLALRLAERAYVLERGQIVRTGSSHELRDDPAVREAYLGL